MIKYSMLALLLLAASCATDEVPPPDMGADQDLPDFSQPEQDQGTAEPDQAQDMPATEDMPVEDMEVTEDMPAEDMPAEDMPPDAEPDAEPDSPPDLPQGDTCEDAIDVTAGASLTGQTTVGATDDYEASFSGDNCPNARFSGPDRAYVVQPGTPTTYTVQVLPEAGFDPSLYVKVDCSQEACVTGTVLNGAGVQESVTFDAPAGVPTFIIVDGEQFSEGMFDLNVTIN